MAERPRRLFNSSAFLRGVGEGRSVACYTAGQTVFVEGDPADSVFYIQSGMVRNSVLSEEGKEAVVALFKPKDFFGEGALAGQTRRMSTAVCQSSSVISRIQTSTIQRLIQDQPAFAGVFITYLLSRSIRVEADLIDQLLTTNEKQMDRLQLLLAAFEKAGHPEPAFAGISQATTAGMIGTTRAHFGGPMTKLHCLHSASGAGKIGAHGPLRNAVLHDQPNLVPDFADCETPVQATAAHRPATVIPFRRP